MALETILLVLVLLYGLMFGSFFNVVIYRLPLGMSLAVPASHCPQCKHKLHWYDLIPVVSYTLGKGKCRYCGVHIPIRYTLVELMTSAVWGVLFYRFGQQISLDFISAVILVSIAINVIFIDLEHYIIPDELVLFGIGAGGLVVFTHYLLNVPMVVYAESPWWSPLLGATLCSGILYVISVIGYKVYKTDDAMGLGDVKFFIPIGIFMGWQNCLMVLMISFVLGALLGCFLILFKKVDRKGGMAFGPIIAVSIFLVYMYGSQLLTFYITHFLSI